jgi:predicted aldo/keto reductase-like oxidoreductase
MMKSPLISNSSSSHILILTLQIQEYKHRHPSASAGAGKNLRIGDAKAIQMMIAETDKTTCRLCTLCQPHCPQQVPIADILRYESYALDDFDWNKARRFYSKLSTKASACISFQTCVQHCPQNLQIP